MARKRKVEVDGKVEVKVESCHREKLVDGKVLFECLKCGKSYGRVGHLNRHVLGHNPTKRYECSYKDCGKSFVDRREHRVHEDRHRGILRYKCELCGKLFGSQSNLINHRRWHSEETRYECQLCGKGWKVTSDLQRHMEDVHSGKVRKSENEEKEIQVLKDVKESLSNLSTVGLGKLKIVGGKGILSNIL